jgi:hypothetical protein
MTKRSPVTPAPGPLEEYAERSEHLFGSRAQREDFRWYLEGLLPSNRRKGRKEVWGILAGGAQDGKGVVGA